MHRCRIVSAPVMLNGANCFWNKLSLCGILRLAHYYSQYNLAFLSKAPLETWKCFLPNSETYSGPHHLWTLLLKYSSICILFLWSSQHSKYCGGNFSATEKNNGSCCDLTDGSDAAVKNNPGCPPLLLTLTTRRRQCRTCRAHAVA